MRKFGFLEYFMDKISLLQMRKQQLFEAGKTIREEINSLIDEDSFVELSAYSFSKNEFYGEEAQGEGVVTGFATVDDYPFYIVAQNPAVLSGGVSKANCEKIAKCLNQAEKASTPVIWLLSSLGVQLGEGIGALEGLADLILKASQLKGSVPQYLIVNGEVYGQLSVLSAIADFTFFIEKKSVLALTSPLVISAHDGKNLPKEKIGGYAAHTNTGIAAFEIKDLKAAREKISAINEILNVPLIDCDDLNEPIAALDKKCGVKEIMSVFDKGSAIELGADRSPEVKCVLGRVGGIAVAAVVFCGEDGVELTASNVRKIKDLAEFASCYDLPYVTFVNTVGVKADIETNSGTALKEIAELVSMLDCVGSGKISVVYGKATGFGYTLFASKSMGYDYVYAFANARIALFDSLQGAEIEYSGDKKADKAALAQKYGDENSDPFNAAKGGYIDNIIRPSAVRQYLIASLQTLLK